MNFESPKILAFDTSTETMFIAVTNGVQVWQHTGEGGAKTSATLIPAIMALMREANVRLADLDAIVFGRGPGSFTGLRTACSVAQGLAFGANVKVLPIDTLLAVAEDARLEHGVNRILAILDARMGEVYSAAYAKQGNGMNNQTFNWAQLLLCKFQMTWLQSVIADLQILPPCPPPWPCCG